MRVPKKSGGILLKICKKRKTQNPTPGLTQSTHNTIHTAAAPAAHQSGPAKRPLERGPPRSRGHAPLERGPPRSRGHAPVRGSASLEGSRPLERGLPRSRVPHERTCSRTCVRAFNALTQQSRATTRLGIMPRRCFANSLGGAHPHHCGGLCDEAGVSSVTLRRPLLCG
jgi:hypothetical protein